MPSRFQLILTLSVVALGTVAASLRSTDESRKMYMFSDMHVDTFYGTGTAYGPCTSASAAPTYGTMGCDTPTQLLTSAMTDIQAQSALDSDSLFVVSGDTLRHQMDAFGDNAIEVGRAIDDLVAGSINSFLGIGANVSSLPPSKRRKSSLGPMQHIGSSPRALLERARGDVALSFTATPNPSIVLTFGNNDAIPDYLYSPIANPAAHPATGNATAVFLAHGLVSPSEASNLSRCGFYSRLLVPSAASPTDPTSPLLFVSLNTLIYSINDTLVNPATQPDPCGQFAWLETLLSEARATNAANDRAGGALFTGSVSVHVMGHIVPEAIKKWNPQYLQTYYALVNSYTDVIRVQWFAHTHMFSFIAVPGVTGPPLMQVPSITPRDGNLPSYLAVSFDSNWNVREVHHRSFDLQGTWSTAAEFGQDFDSALTSPITTASLNAYAQELLQQDKSSPQWLQFLALYQGGSVTIDMGNKDKTKVVCKMLTVDRNDYENCKAANGLKNSV